MKYFRLSLANIAVNTYSLTAFIPECVTHFSCSFCVKETYLFLIYKSFSFFLSAVPIMLSGGMTVNGTLGGNISFHCSYHKGSEINPKYFSKGKPEKEFVRLDRGVMWSRDSRFFLEDDTESKVFTVTIRQLSLEDAGLYWCGVDRWLSDFRTEFRLHIVQDVPTENGEN